MAQSPITCVDLSDFKNRKDEITRHLMRAGTETGFFYICNHGIKQEDIDAAFELNRKFFALETLKKDRPAVDQSNKSYILGYSAEGMAAGVLREGFLCGFDHPNMEGLWPEEADLPGYKEGMLGFMWKCHKVVERLMSCFAVGLGFPEDHFRDAMDPRHQDCGTAAYMNSYPSVEGKPLPQELLRIFAHTDFEILTLLFQRVGQPGLEVCPGKGVSPQTVKIKGKWISVDPLPGCITCNIGDALQYCSDDRLKSTYHRVRLPRPDEYQGARASMAYFGNVRHSTLLQGPGKKYPAITFADILKKKTENEMNSITKEESMAMTPEEYLEYQRAWPTGPEFEDSSAAGG